MITLSLGTSGTLAAHADQPHVSAQGEVATFCASSGGWLPLICTMNLTSANTLVRYLLELDLDQFTALAAQAPVGADGLLMLPFFDGERVPALPAATASLHGMTSANLTRANLCRAVLEGTCFSLRYGSICCAPAACKAAKSAWSAARRKARCGGRYWPTCSACRWYAPNKPKPPPSAPQSGRLEPRSPAGPGRQPRNLVPPLRRPRRKHPHPAPPGATGRVRGRLSTLPGSTACALSAGILPLSFVLENCMYLVCGEALFDVFSLENSNRSSELGFTAIAGGSPFNVAVGLRRLGVESALFGGLSSDYLGARLRRVLEEERVDCRYVVTSAAPTTLAMVGLDANGSAQYQFRGEGCADRQVKLEHLPELDERVRGCMWALTPLWWSPWPIR